MKIARDTLIADSGFLLALFDAHQLRHAAAITYLQRCTQPLITVEAVVVTVAAGLTDEPRRALLNAIAAAALTVLPLEADSYRRLAELCSQYTDPMPDYADLALIELAERTGLTAMLTLKAQDFARYRIKGRKGFDLVGWL